jgi:hypothetical protein
VLRPSIQIDEDTTPSKLRCSGTVVCLKRLKLATEQHLVVVINVGWFKQQCANVCVGWERRTPGTKRGGSVREPKIRNIAEDSGCVVSILASNCQYNFIHCSSPVVVFQKSMVFETVAAVSRESAPTGGSLQQASV